MRNPQTFWGKLLFSNEKDQSKYWEKMNSMNTLIAKWAESNLITNVIINIFKKKREDISLTKQNTILFLKRTKSSWKLKIIEQKWRKSIEGWKLMLRESPRKQNKRTKTWIAGERWWENRRLNPVGPTTKKDTKGEELKRCHIYIENWRPWLSRWKSLTVLSTWTYVKVHYLGISEHQG